MLVWSRAWYWSWYWSVWPSVAQCGPVSRRMMDDVNLGCLQSCSHETPRARYLWYWDWHLTCSSLDATVCNNVVMKVPPIHLTQLEPDQELDLCDPSCHQTAPSDYTRPLDKNLNWYKTHHHYTPQSAEIRRFLCLREAWPSYTYLTLDMIHNVYLGYQRVPRNYNVKN